MRAGVYLRQSGGDEASQSPEEQREATEARARDDGADLVMEVEEVHVSGGKAANLRKLEGLIKAAEAGDLDVIYVADFSRFSREHPFDAMANLARINATGAKLVGLWPWPFDSSDPADVNRIMSDSQEGWQYRERSKTRWANAKDQAIREGRIVGRAPVGYKVQPHLADCTREARKARRKVGNERTCLDGCDGGRLTPDKRTAPAIKVAFELAATGASMREVGDLLTARKVRSSPAATSWAWQSVKDLLGRRVYLGELKLGEVVNEAAHDPIVDLPTWQAAQAAPPRPRVKGKSDLLSGLIRCTGCGFSMAVTTRADGVRVYRCGGKRRCGKCPAPASVRADAAHEQAYLAFLALCEMAGVSEVQADRPNIEPLRKALEDAETRLERHRLPAVFDAMGEDDWGGQYARYRGLRDQAAERLKRAEIESKDQLPDAKTIERIWADASMEARRDLLAASLECVGITRQPRGFNHITAGVTLYPHGTFERWGIELPRQGQASKGLVPLLDDLTVRAEGLAAAG
jgi:site-specific DNA recombinase